MTAGRHVNTLSQSWRTPPKYVRAIKDFWGGRIGLDPCSNEYSIVHAEIEYQLPQTDGLSVDWDADTIFVNPPYGADRERETTIKNWLAKCVLAYEHGSEVIALVPVATNTGHWKKFVFGKATSICFLYDTLLRFLEKGTNMGKGAPMACCLIYWGERCEQFYKSFIEYGAVVNIKDLQDQKIGVDVISPKISFDRQHIEVGSF